MAAGAAVAGGAGGIVRVGGGGFDRRARGNGGRPLHGLLTNFVK